MTYVLKISCFMLLMDLIRCQTGQQGNNRTACIHSDWDLFTSWCYKFFNNESLAWNAAEHFCQKYGLSSHLVVIDGWDVQNIVRDIVNRTGNGTTNYWIGFSDLKTEGNFLDIFDRPMVFKNWIPGQVNGGWSQNCVGASFLFAHQWFDGACSWMHPFVCQMHPDDEVTVTRPLDVSTSLNVSKGPSVLTTPEINDVPCKLNGWRSFDGYCYKFFSTDSKNWFEAKDQCHTWDDTSYLADVYSTKVQDFVAGLVSKTGYKEIYWIGLSDLKQEGVFANALGQRAQFLSWVPGQIIGGRSQNCVGVSVYFNHSWVDGDCNWSNGYVCQMRTSSTINSTVSLMKSYILTILNLYVTYWCQSLF